MVSPFFPERGPDFLGESTKFPFNESKDSNNSEFKSEFEADKEGIFGEDKEETKELDIKINLEKSTMLPKSGGEWSGEPGNSDWKPNGDVEPGDRNGTNPEHKVWSEIMVKYGFESIPFENGEPNFSEISRETVEIDDFSDDRDSNFDQADEKAAEQRGCTPEDVAKWRKKNKYTWHECKDCRTMQKVPTEVHGNIPHSGGISEYKSQSKDM